MQTSGRLLDRSQIQQEVRRKVLRNLDLAQTKAKEEGIKILKKYDDLYFYLKNFAFGRKTQFKVKQALRIMKLKEEGHPAEDDLKKELLSPGRKLKIQLQKAMRDDEASSISSFTVRGNVPDCRSSQEANTFDEIFDVF